MESEESSTGESPAAGEDPTRVLIRQALGAVAQFEKSVIVAKLRAARVPAAGNRTV